MTDNELVQMYTDAYDAGFVKSIEPDECNQQCSDCPANKACSYLAEDGRVSRFVVNYGELLERRPDLKELDNE